MVHDLRAIYAFALHMESCARTSQEENQHVASTPQRIWLVILLVATVVVTSIACPSAQAQDVDTVDVDTILGLGPGTIPWAILFSAFVGAFTAVVVVAKQRITAHKQATLDFLILLKTDRDYKGDEQVFAELVKGDDLMKVDSATTSAEIKQRLSVLNYLNIFELMCLSISQNVLNEDICKYVVGDNLTKRWHNAYPLINAIRNSTNPPDNEFFEHFEKIATAWEANPKVAKRSGIGRIWDEIRKL